MPTKLNKNGDILRFIDCRVLRYAYGEVSCREFVIWVKELRLGIIEQKLYKK